MASSSAQEFTYDNISKEGVFRYLALRSGREEDLLACRLHTVHIQDAPQYEAISYVWGSNNLDHPIVCNDTELHITRNLSMVLRRLRHPHVPRVLWADSICINQADREEKGHQVAMMSEIYRSAACVLIYMGEDSQKNGSQVKSLVEDISDMIDEEKKKIDASAWDTFPYLEVNTFVDDPRWGSLRALLKQEWFTRGWVVREAALAQQGSVIWDRVELSWERLMLALTWSFSRGEFTIDSGRAVLNGAILHLSAFADQHVTAVRCLFPKQKQQKTPLLQHLDDGRRLQLSDPRDRLYAFVDLPTAEEERLKIIPRYDDTPLKVYHDFALVYTNVFNNLGVLEYVVHDAQTLTTKVPTWVPRWDYLRNGPPSYVEADEPLTSRSGTSATLSLIGRATLKVQGVVLDQVQFATDVFDEPVITTESLVGLWTTVESRASDTPYRGSLLQAFIATLTAGRRRGDWKTWQRERVVYTQHLMEAQNIFGDCVDRVADMKAGRMHALIRETLHRNRLVVTSRGYLGLGPAVAQVGDLCAIIFGCRSPCVLRPTEKENHFQFLGRCFILGCKEYNNSVTGINYCHILGEDVSKDWLAWDVEEEDIYLC
jgi:hypothetical protein